MKNQKKTYTQLSTEQCTIFLETDPSPTVQLEETGKRKSKTKKCHTVKENKSYHGIAVDVKIKVPTQH